MLKTFYIEFNDDLKLYEFCCELIYNSYFTGSSWKFADPEDLYQNLYSTYNNHRVQINLDDSELTTLLLLKYSKSYA